MAVFNRSKTWIAALLITVLLGIEFLFGAVAPRLAYAQVQQVQTVPGSVNSTVSDVPRTFRERVLNPIARSMAQTASAVFLRSLTNWVRRGFKGQPQFIKDPEKFFKQLTRQALLNHNLRTAASALCYPFGTGRAGITIPDIPGFPRLKCTVRNPSRLSAFFDDFNEGGWETWNQVLEPQNNFYGQISLLSEEASFAVSDKRKQGELEQVASQGFIGIKNCALKVAFDSVVNTKKLTTESCAQYENVTPGSIVARKVQDTLGQDVQTWVNVHELSDLIGAVTNLLVNNIIGTKFMCLSCAGKNPPAGKTITVTGGG